MAANNLVNLALATQVRQGYFLIVTRTETDLRIARKRKRTHQNLTRILIQHPNDRSNIKAFKNQSKQLPYFNHNLVNFSADSLVFCRLYWESIKKPTICFFLNEFFKNFSFHFKPNRVIPTKIQRSSEPFDWVSMLVLFQIVWLACQKKEKQTSRQLEWGTCLKIWTELNSAGCIMKKWINGERHKPTELSMVWVMLKERVCYIRYDAEMCLT